MGNSSAKVKGYYAHPWREIHLSGTEKDKTEFYREKIRSFTIHKDTKFLNILLLGQAASGKSSFINSCCTAMRNDGRMVKPAGVREAQTGSVTDRIQAHPLIDKDGKWLNIRLYDCRGLHIKDGIHNDDLTSLLKGHIKSGYKFDVGHPIEKTDKFYREEPCLNDKIHCVVYVANSSNPTGGLADDIGREQIMTVQKLITPLCVPQLVLLTNIDLLGLTDCSKVFHSKAVEDACTKGKDFMQLEFGNILPTSNYSKEQKPSIEKDFLALYSVWLMISAANDYVMNNGESDMPEGFYD